MTSVVPILAGVLAGHLVFHKRWFGVIMCFVIVVANAVESALCRI